MALRHASGWPAGVAKYGTPSIPLLGLTMRLVAAFACALTVITLPDPASGEAVTLADDGAVIETSVSYQNTARLNGRLVSTRSRTDRKIVMGPGETGRVEWSMTSQSARGTQTTAPTTTYSFTLAQAREVANMGGGHSVWMLNDGVLTSLRTYKVGGYKLSISFARQDGRLTCVAQESHAREVGAGNNIGRESAFGGDWEIISVKQISSTCEVRKD
jgi:hypothetical protein